jgi:leader peptidase (prepilin peptidase)/N-methyltransferase
VAGVAACVTSERLLARYGDGGLLGRRGARLGVGAAALGVALLGGYVGWRENSWPLALAAVVLTGICLAVSVIDLRVRRIPNVLVAALAVWAVVQGRILGEPDLAVALMGGLVGGGIFALLFILGRGAMGAGDVKFVAAAGLLLGYPLILGAILGGIFLGGLAALVLLVTRRAGRKDAIAYGPYLALGAWAVWVYRFLL